MSDALDRLVKPTLRCFFIGDYGAVIPCGRPAVRLRVGADSAAPEPRCKRHSHAGDAPLTPTQPFRRVRVALVVDLAATSWNGSIAQNCAVVELEELIRALGGVPNVLTATSTIVQPGVPACEDGPIGEPQRG